MYSSTHDTGNMLSDTFQQYKIPFHPTDDYVHTTDGHVHRIEHRYLGTSSIKLGSYLFPYCTFYEIIESEITNSFTKIYNHNELLDDDHHSLQESVSMESVISHVKVLPPKKRKRRRMVHSEIIFTIEKEASTLSTDHIYYLFPRDAMTECLTGAPHMVLFSFYPTSSNAHCDCPPVLEEGLYKTKLEEFAAVCSTSYRMAIPNQNKNAVNLIMSHVSTELFRALKQMVSGYEVMCQNMMELMKIHTNRIHHHKEMALLDAPPIQSDEDYETCRNEDEWSSGDEWDKEVDDEKKPVKSTKNNRNQLKKCLYCGSKSTPMWRRGPQGAGTLCNACGVKWKHGKILNGNDSALLGILDHPKIDKKRKRSYNKKNKTQQKKDYDELTPQWEGQSTSSSTTTDSGSPLDSFSCSPNTSPSLATLMEQHDIKDITSLIPFDSDTLSVYIGEDAVEAAAVLTLLKRS